MTVGQHVAFLTSDELIRRCFDDVATRNFFFEICQHVTGMPLTVPLDGIGT